MMRCTFTALPVVLLALGALLGCGPLVFPNGKGNPTNDDYLHHRHWKSLLTR